MTRIVPASVGQGRRPGGGRILGWAPWALSFWLLAAGCRERPAWRVTAEMDSDPRSWVRVLLREHDDTVTLSSDGPLEVVTLAGRTLRTRRDREELVFSGAGGTLLCGPEPLDAAAVVVTTRRPHVIRVDGRPYRGRMRLQVAADGVRLINEVPMEAYLAGVVGAEMPSYWEPEALKAQAVVARTYCRSIQRRFGRRRDWDMRATQAHQVYRGVAAEAAAVWDAVDRTSGQILVFPDDAGQWRLQATYYSAICGGATAAAADVFGASPASLQAVSCEACRRVTRLDQFFWPLVAIEKPDLERRLAARYPKLEALRPFAALRVSEGPVVGGLRRLVRVTIVGASGVEESLRAEAFRLALDPGGRRIRSTLCRLEDWGRHWVFVNGRGWGHGVGLCQYGAQGMARSGADYQAVLRHYFPQGRLVDGRTWHE